MDRDALPEHVRGQPLEIQVAVLYERVKNLADEVHELNEKSKNQTRALWGFVFSVLCGALLFLLSVAVGWIGPRHAVSLVFGWFT